MVGKRLQAADAVFTLKMGCPIEKCLLEYLILALTVFECCMPVNSLTSCTPTHAIMCGITQVANIIGRSQHKHVGVPIN